ncbi:unnamed protein product [Pseudo-nitzschia multistriata]|uniref:tRNA-uridine aminocarboxypropyltransferase n=1 Tax=Pseudo-nitzschia multistriata TaxID=183589 RepID=A0A448ZNJ3_9STRA|nr:unnamed protein product [Pseudo-nitzschia multistriata]
MARSRNGYNGDCAVRNRNVGTWILAVRRLWPILCLVVSVNPWLVVSWMLCDAFALPVPALVVRRQHRSWPGKTVQSIGSIFTSKTLWKESEGKRSPPTTTSSFVFSRLGNESTGSDTRRKSNNATKHSKQRSASTAGSRGYCPRCKRPNVVCICHALPDEPIDCGTRILILQHPREARKRKRTSTVPLIGLSIQNVEICVGTKFERGSHPLLDEALDMAKESSKGNNRNSHVNGHALLLYPSDGALPLQMYLENALSTVDNEEDPAVTENDVQTAITSAKNDGNSRNSNILVVVDGTWAQTQSMVQNSNDLLWKLPRVMFDETTNSLFDSLRQEPAPHCTSTLEAVSRAIRLLSGSPASAADNDCTGSRGADALEKSLEAMVDGQLRFALDDENARPRYYRKNETGEGTKPVSKREAGRARKLVSKRRQTSLSLPKAKSKEEIELDRIRFVYIAHMG